MVRDESRSHQVVIGEVGDDRGVVLKRARPPTDESQGTPDREIAVYELAADVPRLAAAIPRPLGELAAGKVPLVIERVVGDPLYVALEDPDRSLPTAADLGSRTAAVHSVASDRLGAAFPRRLPWPVAVGDHGQVPFGRDHPAVQQLVDRFRQRPGVAEAMAAAHAGWRNVGLVHGDLKPDNCLVTADGSVVLLDWELADDGDPAWDLAAVLSTLTTSARLGWPVPLGGQRSGDRPAGWWDGGAAEVAGAFLGSYLAEAALDDRDALIHRVAALLPTWTLQTAAQCASWSSATAEPVPDLLAIAEMMYLDPAGTVGQLVDLAA